jgi:hypothetical protein
MKKLIFIDNDHQEKAQQNKMNAYHKLKYTGNLEIKIDDILLVCDFHKKESKFEDELFNINNVIITWSMFTENHFGSYDKLCNFLVMAGLQEIKGKIFIDTATYLADTLERAIEHYNQSVYIIRCIENNFIIHYDEDIEQFKRLRFDMNADSFLRNEDVDITALINQLNITAKS